MPLNLRRWLVFFITFSLFCGYPKPKPERFTYLSELRLKGYPNEIFIYEKDGRTYSFVATGQAGLEIIDITKKDSLKKVLEYSDGANSCQDCWVSESLCFLAYGKKELEILKFFLPETVFPIGANEYSVAYGLALSFDTARNLIYCAAREQFITFDVSDPRYPQDIKKENFPSVRGIYEDGGFLYLACEQLGVFIYQTTDSFPIRVSSFDSSYNARDCWVKDTLLFIADGRYLTIASVADKSSPHFLVSIPISGYAQKVTGFNNYLFLSCGEGGLYLYDISSFPPVEVGRIDLPYVRCATFLPERSWLLVGERDRGIVVYELTTDYGR
uniref:WD40 repeat domain-containing protein n=1 Tax=candidate division WOR-3 bacterium TaxID=2052148 RepID=A0A7C3Z2Y6_UNCW3